MGKLISPFQPCRVYTGMVKTTRSSRELVKGKPSPVYGVSKASFRSAIQSTTARISTPTALASAEWKWPVYRRTSARKAMIRRDYRGGAMTTSFGTTYNSNYKHKRRFEMKLLKRLYRFLTLRVEIRMPRWRHEQGI